jgi:thiamine pyrophosphate-dependent acetolactate synthase large subunit-like protein
MTKIWSTDKDGNDVVKERKARKSSDPKKKKESKKKESKDMDEYSVDELAALLAKKKEEKKKEAEGAEKKGDEGAEKKKEEKKEEKEEAAEIEAILDEEDAETITVDGVEYQMDPDDHRLIHAETFEEVGYWDTETEKIVFDEDYEHP